MSKRIYPRLRDENAMLLTCGRTNAQGIPDCGFQFGFLVDYFYLEDFYNQDGDAPFYMPKDGDTTVPVDLDTPYYLVLPPYWKYDQRGDLVMIQSARALAKRMQREGIPWSRFERETYQAERTRKSSGSPLSHPSPFYRRPAGPRRETDDIDAMLESGTVDKWAELRARHRGGDRPAALSPNPTLRPATHVVSLSHQEILCPCGTRNILDGYEILVQMFEPYEVKEMCENYAGRPGYAKGGLRPIFYRPADYGE